MPAAGAIGDVLAAGPGTVLVEAWRAYGLAVFAGVFVLLAVAPGRRLVLWLLAIGHKLAMTATVLALPAADGAGNVAAADDVLSVLLLVAFALARPWRPARRAPAPAPVTP